MKNIAVIIPYYTPDDKTEALFSRCKASIDDRFLTVCIEDIDHEGVSKMRNKGLNILFDSYYDKYHDVDYITFLDADDTLGEDAYDQIVAAINEQPNEGIIQLNHVREYEDGKTKLRLMSKQGTYTLDRLPNLWVSSVNKVFKADLIRDVRFKAGLNHGEDELFVLECLAKTRRMYVSSRVALHYHKDNPNSLSTTTSLNDLIGEQTALMMFALLHKDDAELLGVIRRRQAELWNNACYTKVFGA